MERSCSIFLVTVLLQLLNCQMPCLAKIFTSLATDQSALLALKAHVTLDPDQIITSNWTNSSSACTWVGVTCSSRHLRVAALDVSSMSLTGTIPPQLGSLSFLVSLDFSYNGFSGKLPHELSRLHRLKFFNVKANSLSGEIPLWLGQLPKLQNLSLGSNSFTGFIPNSISNLSNLETLDVSSNSLRGPIPEELWNLRNLKVLKMKDNHLSGVIPPEIGNLQTLVKLSIAKNQITGPMPRNIFNISSLQHVNLRDNKLTGSLPRDIANHTMLKELSLSYNNFTGVLPQELGQLYQLKFLAVGVNSFTGSIPTALFNVSTLRFLALSSNYLEGSLPKSMCSRLPVLENFYLNGNDLSGVIPDTISNCSKLQNLTFSRNKFTGPVPHSLGSLRNLKRLQLAKNNLRSEASSRELSFITSLANCKSLVALGFNDNPLGGIIPTSIGNLSALLQQLHAHNCQIKGSIPEEIGNLSNLITLDLSGNTLKGSIPLSVKHLTRLQGLILENNKIRGSIPMDLCGFHDLVDLYLSQNQFSGPIPNCFGDLTSLRHLSLSSNMLTSSVPPTVWRLKELLELDLSSNSLSGVLTSEISNLVAAVNVNVSMNQFSGHIPDRIGKLQYLVNLSLGHNKLQGSIPDSIGSMINLEILDLSYNNLSSSIPKSLQSLQHLKYFDVSFNGLIGEIPSDGPFRNFTKESFKANKALCGIERFHVSPCHTFSQHRSKMRRVQIAYIIAGMITCVTIVLLTIIFVMKYRGKEKAETSSDVLASLAPERFSYHELLQATEQFNESNLLGIGSHGSVYKGTLRNGSVLAIKVFNLQSEVAYRSFDVECEVLRNVHHRNLTKVIGSCSNNDFKALVLEYMPNGSLEKWLYSHNHCLDVMQRMNIMIEVASALEYLHYGYSTPIVHCDLKPSNVLLGEDMVAHVSDFGIAKLLGEDSVVHTNTLATIGYIAPEYGLEGLVSTRCDVYSYGIILMETFTKKRPCEEMFQGDLSLKNWVEGLLPESVVDQVLDAKLWNPEAECFDNIVLCVSAILELALKCSTKNPGDRMNIKDVVAELQKIKRQFLASSTSIKKSKAS